MTNNFKITVSGLMQREFNPSETMQWLTANRNVYFSWGVSNRVNYGNKALVLKVSGHHFKGYVVITLGWDDTYNVSLVQTSGRVRETIEGIYCDQLAEIIDEKIERITEYTR